MKDKIGSRESQPSLIAIEMGKTLAAMDQARLRRVFVDDPDILEGITSLVIGAKPAYEFGKDEFGFIKPCDFIPEPLKKEFGMGRNFWLYNIPAVRLIITENSDIFSDFDQKKLGDDEYLNRYVSSQSTLNVGTKKIDRSRTGLLLGFPRNSVLAFPSRSLVSFQYRGYGFAASPEDVGPFRGKIDGIYKASGVDAVLSEAKKRVESEFIKGLDDANGSIQILDNGGKKYLEIRYDDVSRDTSAIQFGLLTRGAMSKEVAHRLLEFAYQRTGLRALSGGSINAGGRRIYYGTETHGTIMKKLSGFKATNHFYYLEIHQKPSTDLYGISRIKREDMRIFLVQNGKEEFAHLV